MWFLIWFLLGGALIGIFIWSLRVIVQQKKTWKAFAAANGFTYESNALLQTPTMRRSSEALNILFYAKDVDINDPRAQRTLIVAEMDLKIPVLMRCLIGKVGEDGAFDALPFVYPHDGIANEGGLKDLARIGTFHTERLAAWLTPRREKAIAKMFAWQHVSSIVMAEEGRIGVYLESRHPLHTPKTLETLYQRLNTLAKIFKIDEDEANVLKALDVKEEQPEDRGTETSPA